jgi:cytidylate kinase
VQRRNLVVAIDGPSGSGKSTVSRGVAERLGLRYLDTGSMYRAITWLVLNREIPLDAVDRLAELAATATLAVNADPAAPTISIEGTDVTIAVRGSDVTTAVSAVSAVAGVRQAMVARQREIIGAGGIVVEGRDIGTTVVPDAAVKIFLIADAAARARRRVLQDSDLGVGGSTVTAIEADLARRDTADSTRVASPLTQASDAVVVDSTALDAAAVIQRVVELAERVSA